MNIILTLFQGPQGDISSKRVAALALVVCGIVYLFINRDAIGGGTMIGSGCALLGVQAVTGK
jgi:hypothetical protein